MPTGLGVAPSGGVFGGVSSWQWYFDQVDAAYLDVDNSIKLIIDTLNSTAGQRLPLDTVQALGDLARALVRFEMELDSLEQKAIVGAQQGTSPELVDDYIAYQITIYVSGDPKNPASDSLRARAVRFIIEEATKQQTRTTTNPAWDPELNSGVDISTYFFYQLWSQLPKGAGRTAAIQSAAGWAPEPGGSDSRPDGMTATNPQTEQQPNNDPQTPPTTNPQKPEPPTTSGGGVNVTTSPTTPSSAGRLGITNVRPAEQRFIGGNTPMPLGGGGQEGDGSSFVGGFGFGDGGYYGGGNLNRVTAPSGPEPAGVGGGESTPQQQTAPNPQDDGDGIWQTGGPEKTNNGSSDITDDNRTRYDNASTLDSSSTANADTGVSGGSREDPPGPPDRAWTSGRNLGGFGWDPNANRGDPNPEDDGGGSESKPTIPYGPHRDQVGGAPWPTGNPRLPSFAGRLLAQRLRRAGRYGYQSADDLGAGGYNPRFNPDPDDGGAPGGGDGIGGPWSAGSVRGGTLGGADATNISSDPNGPDPDNEWGAGGYNPHYQPAGYTWTPYSRGGGVGTTRAAPALALPARGSRVAAIRFK